MKEVAWRAAASFFMGSVRRSYRAFWVLCLSLCLAVGLKTNAEFTDANWGSVGSGVDGSVHALAVMGTNVFAGGSFSTAGGKWVSNVARWDGRDWWPLGSGMDSTVYALAVSGTNLYAGGSFKSAGGQTAYQVARWDGNTWWPLGRGIVPNFPWNGVVYSLAVSGTNVYAGGAFSQLNNAVANSFAVWNGWTWSNMWPGFSGSVLAIAISGKNLYAGGDFSKSFFEVRAVARWDGSWWLPLGPGVTPDEYPYVRALTFSGTNLFVGGAFRTSVCSDIGVWDGFRWSAARGLTGGKYSSPVVYALTAAGTNVYAGGDLTAGAVKTNRVASWNGTAWTGLASGVNGNVRALAVSGADLYVGGDFTMAGKRPALRIARAYLPDLPRLEAHHQPTGLQLAWPSSSTEGFRLEERQPPSTNWVSLNATTSDDGTKRTVLLPPGSGMRYYRLRRQ